MLTPNFSFAEIQLSNYKRFREPSALVQKRLHTIYLKSLDEFTHQQIAKIVDIDLNSVTKYLHLYEKGGLDLLQQTNYGTNVSRLDQVEGLEDMLKKQPPKTIKEARQRIIDYCGIALSLERVRVYLKRIGLKRLKTGHVPAKANPEKQQEWLNDELQPIINQAFKGEIHLFFMDAAHFVFAPFLCYLWCVARVFIKAPAGRKRVNVLGAVNAVTKQIHFLSNCSYINANTIVEFLYQLRIYYYEKPIYIVLDNARYQHCILVRSIAGLLNIHLLFLPAYSPNLNIIERLWKFMKKECLGAKYFESFELFKNHILNFMKQMNSEYQEELQSLLTLKFQVFSKSDIYP